MTSSLPRLFSCRLGSIVATAFAILALGISPLMAQQRSIASVSDIAGAPNAVFITVPNAPCDALYDSLSTKITALKLDFGPVKLDQRAFFMSFCDEQLDKLKEQIKAPFDAAYGQLEEAGNAAAAELVGGFWKFMAEQLYAALPAEEQEKYTPGSPEVQELAHRWLNEAPQEEFGTYVAAYLTAGGQESRLLNAWKIYVDLTNGESKTILTAMYQTLSDARQRLDQILGAKRQMETDPDTPTIQVLEDVGLSGKWVDNLKSYEGQLRALDSSYHISDAMEIVSGAMGTDDQAERVRGFFKLIELSGGIAADSPVPLASFVGQIIEDYAAVAQAVLDQTLALENAIQKRSGFCLGVGIASRDSRQSFFVERNLLACPLALDTWPFKHVYKTQGAGPARFFFFDGNSFVEAENATGRDGVIAAHALIQEAIGLGYPVTADPTDHIARIAAVYNTSHPGGVPALLEEARQMVDDITGLTDAVERLSLPGDTCSADQILGDIAAEAGLSRESLSNALARGGPERLTYAIAASFIAFEGRFGADVVRGSDGGAYETYQQLAEAMSSTSVLLLEGRVQDDKGNALRDARVEIDVASGRQVRGCEVSPTNASGRFFVAAIGTNQSVGISARAIASDTEGARENFDVGYFRRNGTLAARGNSITARADATLTLAVAQPDEESDPKEDEEEQPVETPPVPPAACMQLEAEIASLRTNLSAGAFDTLGVSIAQLNDAIALAKSVETCEPGLVGDADTLITLAQNAQAEYQFSETALKQCQPAELVERVRVLREYTDVNFSKLIARIEAAQRRVRAFEDALQSYKDNRLDLAERTLTNLQGQFAEDCTAYASRVEQGLRQIAALRQFDSRVSAAISACDTDLLQRMKIQIADRRHRYFGEATARINAALESCSAKQERAAAQATCDQVGVALNFARDAYKANRLNEAMVLLLDAQSRLGPETDQICPEIATRIARGLSNIDHIRAEEAALQAAEAACDIPRLEVLRTRASGQSHIWFTEAVGRLDDALEKCQQDASRETCEALVALRSEANAHLVTGAMDKARMALLRADDMARDPDRAANCESEATQIRGDLARVDQLIGLISQADAAVSGCDTSRIETAISALQPHLGVNDKIASAIRELRSARESCQEPEVVTPQPAAPTPTVPLETDEGSALEMLRAASSTFVDQLGDSDGVYLKITVPLGGDESSAFIKFEVEGEESSNDVLDARVTFSMSVHVKRYASEAEARPRPRPGEKLEDFSEASAEFAGMHVVVPANETLHPTFRFSKGRYYAELKYDKILYVKTSDNASDDSGLSLMNFSAYVLTAFIYQLMDPSL